MFWTYQVKKWFELIRSEMLKWLTYVPNLCSETKPKVGAHFYTNLESVKVTEGFLNLPCIEHIWDSLRHSLLIKIASVCLTGNFNSLQVFGFEMSTWLLARIRVIVGFRLCNNWIAAVMSRETTNTLLNYVFALSLHHYPFFVRLQFSTLWCDCWSRESGRCLVIGGFGE